MRRLTLLALALATIGAGLLLRLVPWGLPLPIHHYGGGILWGAMVYLLVACLQPAGWGFRGGIAAASAVALAVELVRLIHAPWLDAFRATVPGQLLLGRVFSAWNLIAYAAGIALAAGAARRLTAPRT